MKTTKLFAFLMLGMTFMANVSSCSNNDDNESSGSGSVSSGTLNDHQYVDLGLSVRWATCNWGASQSGPGMYNSGATYTYTKKTFSTYDVATAEWGTPWRRPTGDEILELFQKCTWKMDPYLGGDGCAIVTGPNGNKMYLPVARYFSRDMDSRNDYVTGFSIRRVSEDVVTGYNYYDENSEICGYNERYSYSSAEECRKIIKKAKNMVAFSVTDFYGFDPVRTTVYPLNSVNDDYDCYAIDNGFRNAKTIYLMSDDEAYVYKIAYSEATSFVSEITRNIRPVAPY